MRAWLLVALACVPWLPLGVYVASRVRRRWIVHEEEKRTRERFAREAFYD